MRMKGGDQQSQGFTIVEVLIVLAITGVMLAAAIEIIGDKVNITAYSQAINTVQSQLQQVIGTVANGTYPNFNNFTCTSGQGSGAPDIIPGTGQEGQNEGCIYLGRAVHFYTSSSSYGKQYTVYTVVGRQCATGSSSGPGLPGCEPISTISSASPVVLAPATVGSTVPDDSNTVTLNSGITVSKIQYCLTTPCTSSTAWTGSVGSLSFVTDSLSTYSASSTNGLVSGTGQVDLLAYTSTGGGFGLDNGPAPGDYNAANAINTTLQNSNANTISEARICFVSGSTNQSDWLTIQPGDGELTTSLTEYQDKTCS